MVRMDPQLLLDGLDDRWTRDYQDRCIFDNGVSSQSIEVSLQFLGYRCPSPKCGFLGMCAEHCYFCKDVKPTAGKSTFLHSAADADKAWKAWQLTVQGTGSKSKQAFYAACPKYAPQAASSKATDPTTLAAFYATH